MSNAPKVTSQDVNNEIVSATYTLLPNGRTTVCQLTLKNGFTVEGISACVVLESYNEELGNKIARERAEAEVWKLLGFNLATDLSRHRITDEEAAADLAGVPRPTSVGDHWAAGTTKPLGEKI